MRSIVCEAAVFAARAHDGQVRKGSGIPYILHPMEVASIVSTLTDDEEVIAAALLHDTIEDTAVTEEEIRALFGDRVASLVAHETEDKLRTRSKEETWLTRKRESLKRLSESDDVNVLYLWIGDKLSNLRAMRRECDGPRFFERFNQKDPAMHAWYYRNILRLLEPIRDTDAYREAASLTESLFGAYTPPDDFPG